MHAIFVPGLRLHPNLAWMILWLILLGSNTSHAQLSPKREFRGVWVTTIHNLDWPSSKTLSPEKQKAEFIQILEHCERNNLNAVMVQIRASGDAFYESATEPWSYWLTGSQGKAPSAGFDPLQFMVEECHARNIEFHAWFNLFRAVSHTKFSPPCKTHAAERHKDWCYKMGNSKFFNPGIPEVRDYLEAVVMEVVQKYDIDGVHMDDYFYHQELNGHKIADWKHFSKYGSGFSSIGDWRRNNIDLLIESLSVHIKEAKPWVKFGISPTPVWRHDFDDPHGSKSQKALTSYDDLYADSRKWIKEGWVDYMLPQLYWTNEHLNVKFSNLLKWWSQNSFDRHLYIGLAIYKVGTEKKNGWDQPGQIPDQIRETRKNTHTCGQALYKVGTLGKNALGVEDSLQTKLYPFPALPPTMPWIDSIPPNAPTNLEFSSVEDWTLLRWKEPSASSDGETASRYMIYRFGPSDEVNVKTNKNLLAVSKGTSFIDKTCLAGSSYIYIITSLDRVKNESPSFLGAWHQTQEKGGDPVDQ